MQFNDFGILHGRPISSDLLEGCLTELLSVYSIFGEKETVAKGPDMKDALLKILALKLVNQTNADLKAI